MMARAAILLLVLAALPLPARAQRPGSAAPADTAATSARPELWLGLGLVAGTAALLPLDQAIADELASPGAQGADGLQDLSAAFRIYGIGGTFLIGGGAWAAGALAGSPELAAAGLHATEAIVLSQGVVFAGKALFGRARPDRAPDDALSFELGRGLDGESYQSYPSGHTAAAFALATALTLETRQRWPHATKYLAPPLYGGALLAGLSRMYDARHWASDVLAGAATGSLAGLAVVRWHRAHPDNALDAWLLPRAALPARDGILLVWSLPAR